MANFVPSPQQQTYFDWISEGKGSCILEAVAGSGKTTTLIRGLERMRGDIFFGAYNKKIAEEIKTKTDSLSVRGYLNVSTMHAAGFAIWRRFARTVKVEDTKTSIIYRDLYQDQFGDIRGAVLQIVSLAKQSGFGPLVTPSLDRYMDLIDHFNVDLGEYDETVVIGMVRAVLAESVRRDSEVIDFDDMIFAPLYHKCRPPKEYDWVLIDEAQDTNATRRALALLLLKRGGRLVAVGDPHQAIYGFTGADADSLKLIAEAVSACHIPLTVSYRCPKSVTEFARQYVDHIRSTPSAPTGSVVTLPTHEALFDLVSAGDAILCRFNAPIVGLVYGFIAKGVPAKIEGRDIGNNLKVLARKWRVKKADTFVDKLDAWCEKETVKLRIREKESLAVSVEDRVRCLHVLVNRCLQLDPQCPDIVQAICSQIDSLFSDNVGKSTKHLVLLSSIHRSKGCEWNRVFWLQAGESKWARKDWEKDQEVNLSYVAITRAQQELYLVPMPPKEK